MCSYVFLNAHTCLPLLIWTAASDLLGAVVEPMKRNFGALFHQMISQDDVQRNTSVVSSCLSSMVFPFLSLICTLLAQRPEVLAILELDTYGCAAHRGGPAKQPPLFSRTKEHRQTSLTAISIQVSH